MSPLSLLGPQVSLGQTPSKAHSSSSDKLDGSSRILYGCKKVSHHLQKHVGVGIICAVAYFDPGNWSVDLQAGSQFGYRPMLFVLLVAGLGAMVLQSLAYKLGCVTGLDLASHCRLLLHDRPKHPRLIRYTVLYPLYILCEIAIICTDLAELLGSAIGLCLIFPSLELWAAVLLTAGDVLVFLLLGDPSRGQGRPVKLFELTVILLVFAVLVCFVVLLIRVKPDWHDVLLGFVPSEGLFDTHPDALYTAVGILGATVMPHALFLGSFLATQDRIAGPAVRLPDPAHAPGNVVPSTFGRRFRAWLKSLFAVSRAERIAASREYRNKYGRENNELSFIRAHLVHGLVDVIASLLALAVPINSAILIIAATVFFETRGASSMSAGLFDAHDLIKEHIGKAAAFIFALSLLCAGQTASITATLAGQIVSEGFLEWRISPFMRRIITRLMGLVPSMVVAIGVGRPGINTLLVASQVALSIVLPFVAFPLIWLTSSTSVMRVRKPVRPHAEETKQTEASPADTECDENTEKPEENNCEDVDAIEHVSHSDGNIEEVRREDAGHVAPDNASEIVDEYIDFSNGWAMTGIASLIFIVIIAANIYVLVILGSGQN